MDELRLKILCSAVLAEIIRRSEHSPMGHALRADVAVSLGINYQDALDAINALQERGEIIAGPTVNDYWARPAKDRKP